MKPLTQEECLIPVGIECMVPSFIEAYKQFAQQNFHGEITFGITRGERGDNPCWVMLTSEKTVKLLKAFVGGNYSQVTSFFEITPNTFFVWRNKHFKLVPDNDFKLVIKEVNIFSTETEVLGYAHMKEYGDVKIHVVKIYQIGEKYKYLFPSWYIEMPEDAAVSGAFFPMFISDRITMSTLDTNSLNWEFIDPGDTFFKDGELWKLYENEEDGLFINRASNLKLVINNQTHP